MNFRALLLVSAGLLLLCCGSSFVTPSAGSPQPERLKTPRLRATGLQIPEASAQAGQVGEKPWMQVLTMSAVLGLVLGLMGSPAPAHAGGYAGPPITEEMKKERAANLAAALKKAAERKELDKAAGEKKAAEDKVAKAEGAKEKKELGQEDKGKAEAAKPEKEKAAAAAQAEKKAAEDKVAAEKKAADDKVAKEKKAAEDKVTAEKAAKAKAAAEEKAKKDAADKAAAEKAAQARAKREAEEKAAAEKAAVVERQRQFAISKAQYAANASRASEFKNQSEKLKPLVAGVVVAAVGSAGRSREREEDGLVMGSGASSSMALAVKEPEIFVPTPSSALGLMWEDRSLWQPELIAPDSFPIVEEPLPALGSSKVIITDDEGRFRFNQETELIVGDPSEEDLVLVKDDESRFRFKN